MNNINVLRDEIFCDVLVWEIVYSLEKFWKWKWFFFKFLYFEEVIVFCRLVLGWLDFSSIFSFKVKFLFYVIVEGLFR